MVVYSMLDVYIGYDAREHIAAQVCKHSLVRRSSEPVDVTFLSHKGLRMWHGFDRPWHMDSNGQMWDNRDKRPFSTEFSHARFMAPLLHKEKVKNKGANKWALFIDCDFLFLHDVAELFEYGYQSNDAVRCVKRNWRGEDGKKMDNVIQEGYNRKLWSSLFLFNVEHPAITLMLDDVNNQTGRWLHNFKWVTDDEAIGDLPSGWNYIPEDKFTSPRPNEISAVHYSYGGPYMEGYEDVEFGDEWRKEYDHYISCKPKAY